MTMKNILIKIILVISFLIFLCELDRRFLIPHNFSNYYIKNFPKQILHGIHNTVYKLYENRMIFDVEEFKFHNYLIKNKNKIRKEFNQSNQNIQIYAHTTSEMLKKDNNYKYINFKIFNKDYPDNINVFPTIKKFLNQFNNIRTCFFSIMKKNKIIPYHRGPYSGVLRYHLPVIVTNPKKCYIEVMGTKLFYDKSFIFDDTYPHKFVKLDDSLRVVLICDVDNKYSYLKHHLLFN